MTGTMTQSVTRVWCATHFRPMAVGVDEGAAAVHAVVFVLCSTYGNATIRHLPPVTRTKPRGSVTRMLPLSLTLPPCSYIVAALYVTIVVTNNRTLNSSRNVSS